MEHHTRWAQGGSALPLLNTLESHAAVVNSWAVFDGLRQRDPSKIGRERVKP